jgi:SAM-dependent methyltransferase
MATPPSRVPRFARWATDYDASQLQWVLYEPVHRRVLGYVRRRSRPTRILDVGCGTGRLTTTLSRAYPGVRTIGIDASPEMIGQAAAVDGPVTWLCCAAEALPFRDGGFDLVVSALSLRHWYDPGRGLAEAGRVTAPVGTLVIADALIGDAPIGDAPNTPARRRRPRWQAARLPADLRRVLREAGLRLDRVEPIALPVPLTTVTLITASKPRRPARRAERPSTSHGQAMRAFVRIWSPSSRTAPSSLGKDGTA